MTSTTRSSGEGACYYNNEGCAGDLWRCQTCGEFYCSGGHNHHTAKGTNVECVACERERKDAALLAAGPGRAVDRATARVDVGRLDIPDK